MYIATRPSPIALLKLNGMYALSNLSRIRYCNNYLKCILSTLTEGVFQRRLTLDLVALLLCATVSYKRITIASRIIIAKVNLFSTTFSKISSIGKLMQSMLVCAAGLTLLSSSVHAHNVSFPYLSPSAFSTTPFPGSL